MLKKLLASTLCTAALIASAANAQECHIEPVKVGFLPKLDTDPYFQVAGQGADLAVKEIGGERIQLAPNQATAEAQTEFINNMVAQGVKVIAISGSDANAVAPALKRAMANGVRVISYDSDVAVSARTLFINQARGSSLAAMMLKSMSDLIGEGEFAILSSTPTATNQNAWIAQMKEEMISNADYAGLKLVQVAYGEESEQINQQQTIALAQAYPNLKGIIVPAGIGLPAAARALEEAGLTGKIKLTGLAPASLIKKYIKNGSAQDIWWNVSDLGYLTYYAAQALAQCKVKGKEGETFNAGKLGTYTIGSNGEVILGEAKIVTPENLEDFKF
ncbi:Rhamnose ABC transporter, periplasmic rhamnose-binding protein [Vibrio nigripulchritudo MADA3029]|uniref:rhamnose ABC transporter substrate-binding protein n=1 Tax=Vibrio nigripulchritudo TaxID=28173 RepID=UPI0003B1FE68|nr:rhamnose ABC transporter substrate-binding protein [Vibrio nigripulchritudo]CCN47706.1 Rhamnose ABC transporter, periplasmic rhamnose-binding protein [Vibrio nigripulchritudo MADA3020]CCN56081.1 Rhamnose ABC transporter, periplasmic rhamnose-binding protein [Vibrio nigripulchritudo MADA3021]CCN58883.1 Rhamnose ABC transporter, periplasmic rhamnose-binding protein [Vibrio nigripulchritudo MADA3029]BDU41193.1 rhamnose ABC transporter substrate-binding protein [Vibrio nigripulchritudo]BDU46958